MELQLRDTPTIFITSSIFRVQVLPREKLVLFLEMFKDIQRHKQYTIILYMFVYYCMPLSKNILYKTESIKEK